MFFRVFQFVSLCCVRSWFRKIYRGVREVSLIFRLNLEARMDT
ncbi:hypothetical protein LEP1GSC043_3214 [Leptospira weilii str. Ecochallenge]|uniref:Uncharacterized protein n=1 Tax=Leptospira weilii str. Ecochallenge TaxID=1049986 RepID=N1U8Y7_9LEPT|nr:hypothetical protein LEP1GSC043_3214 [Leptospira weilii str. Ecochallenge]